MNLLIDIGNQFIKWCYGESSHRFPSDFDSLGKQFQQNWMDLQGVKDIVYVNVADASFAEQLGDFCLQAWNVEPYELKPAASCCGVKNTYRGAGGLGADRWAAAIGAWSLVNDAAVIVDCGTAITIDGLTCRGEYIGGSIMPGIRLARQSLSTHTSRIGDFKGTPIRLPGGNAAEGVSSGVYFGAAGGIDRLVDEYLELLGDKATLFITGGDAYKLTTFTKHQFIHQPHLVLLGLAEVARFKSE